MDGTKKHGSTWWGLKWRLALESFNWKSRLQRGRTYARGGMVRTISVLPGVVQAEVAGSRAKPYRVWIRLTPYTEQQWERVLHSFASRPLFVAKLLAGEMPEQMESALEDAGLHLFPVRESDLNTECSCPDWVNPCKHIAAVYYKLEERLDEDPFLLFKLRGMDREEMLRHLRQGWANADQGQDALDPANSSAVSHALDMGNSLLSEEKHDLWEAARHGSFWMAGPELDKVQVDLHPEAVAPDSLVRSWGMPPFLPAESAALSVLAELVRQVSDETRALIEELEKKGDGK